MNPFRPLLFVLLLVAPLSAQRGLTVNLGTVVPKGSAWHETLERMSQEWARISGGRVRLRILPGGALGDDVEMLRLVRVGRLQAVAMTGIGLAKLDPGVDALHIPLLFDSYAELDYVRDKMAPTLEARLATEGFVVLNWADGGWAQFFTKRSAATLDELRKQKLWISAGDPRTERLYKRFDMTVTPLSMGDVPTGLQTGLIEAITIPPLFAMLDGSYRSAPNLIDLKWAPVTGGVVVSNTAWEKIPADLRPKLLAASREAGDELRTKIRRLGDDAVAQMKTRGLNVVAVDRAAWQKEVEAAYPELRGELAPEELFDMALRLRDEFRARRAASR